MRGFGPGRGHGRLGSPGPPLPGMPYRREGDTGAAGTSAFSLYRRLLGYLKPHWPKIAMALPFVCAAALARVYPAKVVGLGVDAGTGMATTLSAGGEADFRPLIYLALAYVGLFAVAGGFGFLNQYWLAQVGQRIILKLRTDLHDHLQRLSLRYYEGERTGEVLSRVMGDVQAVESSLLGPIVGLVQDFSTVGGVLTVGGGMDWRLTAMVVGIAPPLALFMHWLGRRIRESFRIVREKAADLTAVLHDGIAGIRVVRGFAREPEQAQRFGEVAEESYEWNIRVARLLAGARPVMRLLTASGGAVVLLYGGWQVAYGRMTPGELTAFFLLLRMAYRPIFGLGRTYSIIQQAMAAAERVFDLLDTEPEIVDAPDARDVRQISGHVEFKNVSFAYNEQASVLRDVSLTAESGQMIAIVGPSGAGKSTLVNLIPRFYEVSDGSITVDGYDIRELKQRSLRRHIGMVMQETFLFNTTVRENIAYGKPEASEDEIVAAAQAANAHDFIEAFPDGYETQIGERGVKLSGGERQRIAIARAILSDPRILILDEATSSVDSETEILIQQAIDRLVAERTTFCIAHRLSTVQNADRILVLDEGRVVEEGSHEELMARGGLYQRLYETQFRLALPETAATEAPLSVAEDDDVRLVDFDADDEVPI